VHPRGYSPMRALVQNCNDGTYLLEMEAGASAKKRRIISGVLLRQRKRAYTASCGVCVWC
jgi:hypothetical protein